MKSTEGWSDDGDGTNESGFNGLPGGSLGFEFEYIGDSSYWWSSSEEFNERKG